MQYLLLIYEKEQRFRQGFDPAEMSEYGAFGEEFKASSSGIYSIRAASPDMP